MEKIGEIYKLFHPEPKKGNGGGSGKASKEEYIRAAKRKGIKLPSKGI